MTDSQHRILARVVRILACLLFVWGVLLLLDTNPPQGSNDAAGYLLLVVGPLVMLGARWIDPAPRSASAESGEDSDEVMTPSARSQDTDSEVTNEEPK